MTSPVGPQTTDLTLDTMGRFLCNTLQEARDSVAGGSQQPGRPFDVIVVGGGTFGAVIAQSLFENDPTHSRRILVVENGPYVIPEHIQNMSFGDPTPGFRVPWEAHPGLRFPGLLFAVGGRSLKWGGWSPEPLHDDQNDEMAGWPDSVARDLKGSYFHLAGEQIGVNRTNDFVFGALHRALRARLFDELSKPAARGAAIDLDALPESPIVRAFRLRNERDPSDAELRTLLDLEATNPTPRADLINLLKLEAPLAVESRSAEAGLFPGNKFSSVPLLTKAARQAAVEADGVGAEADARKRLMVVPGCHVQELITETQADGWVRVTGVRLVGPGGTTAEFHLPTPHADGRQGAVVLAAGTIESTRIALTTFRDSLSWRAAQRMGRNLLLHLRSNFTMRIPRDAYPGLPGALQSSALFVKGKARVGARDRYFHLQITASGLGRGGTNSEAELFKKIPDLDTLESLRRADDETIVIVLRGIGEMSPQNPDSGVTLTDLPPQDFSRPRAQVSIGNALADDPAASQETLDDGLAWEAMDAFTERVALALANGQPFELLTPSGVKPMPAGASPDEIRLAYPLEQRRDALGTTHHEAGTLWMGDDPARSVTNPFGRIHDTTNAYVVGPALSPTTGSPNPMLSGVALARRTGEMLAANVLPLPRTAPEAGFRALFDGTREAFGRWQAVGQGKFDLREGAIVTRPGSDLGLLYFPEPFGDFELRLQFLLDRIDGNSGVFVRFRDPRKRVPRRDGGGSDLYWNPSFVAVDTGFEVQIDELARGDARRGEPDGMDKRRTGALYDIPTTPGWIAQTFRGRPRQARLADWNELRIEVRRRAGGDEYRVHLNDELTTTYTNTDPYRGRGASEDPDSGYIGLQSHTGQVAFRNIRIRG